MIWHLEKDRNRGMGKEKERKKELEVRMITRRRRRIMPKTMKNWERSEPDYTEGRLRGNTGIMETLTLFFLQIWGPNTPLELYKNFNFELEYSKLSFLG